MTNIEWLRTLSAEELVKFLREGCHTCIHYDDYCIEAGRGCNDGKVAWLNAEHKEEIKPCANCGGEAKFVADVMKINPNMGFVQCCECHIRTPVGTKHNVINIWNRRVDNAD